MQADGVPPSKRQVGADGKPLAKDSPDAPDAIVADSIDLAELAPAALRCTTARPPGAGRLRLGARRRDQPAPPATSGGAALPLSAGPRACGG